MVLPGVAPVICKPLPAPGDATVAMVILALTAEYGAEPPNIEYSTGVLAFGGMAMDAGAVVNSAIGAGTVTAIVSFVPAESVTTTLAVPPCVLASAEIVNCVPVTSRLAVTKDGALLCAAYFGAEALGAPSEIR